MARRTDISNSLYKRDSSSPVAPYRALSMALAVLIVPTGCVQSGRVYRGGVNRGGVNQLS